MIDYIFPPAKQISLPIIGTEARFPVRRIYCIGKNYADHVAEMGGDASRSEPIFFTKSAQTLVSSGAKLPYPPNTENLHFEVEMVIAMGPSSGIFGYGVGIDLTRRDIQAAAKSKGGPWDRAKNFAFAAPCSALTPAKKADLADKHITLHQNDVLRQDGPLAAMIWRPDEIIARLREDMDLQAGDLIYTGTPAGVGPCVVGDRLVGQIDGLEPISVTLTS